MHHSTLYSPVDTIWPDLSWTDFWPSALSFLASQDALEVMRVTESLTYSLSVSIDFTDVTLVSDDTYRRLY